MRPSLSSDRRGSQEAGAAHEAGLNLIAGLRAGQIVRQRRWLRHLRLHVVWAWESGTYQAVVKTRLWYHTTPVLRPCLDSLSLQWQLCDVPTPPCKGSSALPLQKVMPCALTVPASAVASSSPSPKGPWLAMPTLPKVAVGR